jgi:hypothetical protein
MHRFLLGTFAGLVVFGMTAAPAAACKNDREVGRAERQFKSDYLEQEEREVPSSEEYSPRENQTHFNLTAGFTGLGSVLLVAGIVLSLLKPGGRK